MRATLAWILPCALFVGCIATDPACESRQGIPSRPRPPVVYLAVNLGLEHTDDLIKLRDSLARTELRCGSTAMSLDAMHIVVEAGDFDRARAMATGIISRDRLTVRVYKSSNIETEEPFLEVWEKGQNVREENYKLYLGSFVGERLQ